MLLSDPLQIGVTERGDTLLLAMRNDFAATMADRPDVLSTLSALASDTAGRPIRVQTGAPDLSANQRSAEELARKLDELRKFNIVTIKEE